MFPMVKKSKKITPAKKSKKKKNPAKVTLNFKVEAERAKQIRRMADRFTLGNVTALVVAGLSYVPKHGAAIKKIDHRPTTRA